jgi:hypothetical protein
MQFPQIRKLKSPSDSQALNDNGDINHSYAHIHTLSLLKKQCVKAVCVSLCLFLEPNDEHQVLCTGQGTMPPTPVGQRTAACKARHYAADAC